MKLNQRNDLEDLKKKHNDLCRVMFVLAGYYQHLEDNFAKSLAEQSVKIHQLEHLQKDLDKKISERDEKIGRLENLVQRLILHS